MAFKDGPLGASPFLPPFDKDIGSKETSLPKGSSFLGEEDTWLVGFTLPTPPPPEEEKPFKLLLKRSLLLPVFTAGTAEAVDWEKAAKLPKFEEEEDVLVLGAIGVNELKLAKPLVATGGGERGVVCCGRGGWNEAKEANC